MYALKTDRQIKDKVRKEKCSAINTLTIELIKKHEALKYAFKMCKIEEHSQLSQSDNYKIISLRLSLAYDYYITILNKPQLEAIRLIFVEHFWNLQQLIYHKFGNTNPQTVIQGLYTKSINDLLVFKQTFQNNRDDIDQICQNLKGLYNQNIADQPQHARDIKKLAYIIKKYSNYFKNQSVPQKAELLISTKDQQEPQQPIRFDLKRSSSIEGQLEVDRKTRIILSLNPLIPSEYQTLIKSLNIQNKQIELTQQYEELLANQLSLEMHIIDQITQRQKSLFSSLLE